jgi:GR25 family glycosyltransferase involved in LPS biosynthesis
VLPTPEAAAPLPPVYWINLERSAGRRERMLARFAGRGIRHRRVAGVDGCDAALVSRIIRSRAKSSANAACIASHLRAIEQACADGHETFLIMEDDVTFEPYDAWPGGYRAILAELPAAFGALALSIAESPRHLDALFAREGLVQPLRERSYWSAGAYVMTRAGADYLLGRYRRKGGYDVTSFAGHQHAYEVVMRTLQASRSARPFLSRIPLFLFEGEDSEIHTDHLGEHRRARDYLRAHYPALIASTYVSPFTLRARLDRLMATIRSTLQRSGAA